MSPSEEVGGAEEVGGGAAAPGSRGRRMRWAGALDPAVHSDVLVRALEQLAGDDEALDLRGALVDPEQAGVAVEALDARLAHVAHAAVDLDAAIRDASQPLRGEELRGRRAQLAVRARVPAPCGVEDERAGRAQLRVAVGQLRLDELEVRDGAAALLRVLRVLDRVVEDAGRLADADRADVQAALIQRG